MFPPGSKIKEGLTNPRKAVEYLLNTYNHVVESAVLEVTTRYPVGTPVLDREWDLLVVLDTCRVDAMKAVAEEYSFISDVDKIWSQAGSSPEWIAHTFDKGYEHELRNTAYLSANPHTETVIEDQRYLPEKHGEVVERFYRHGDWNPVKSTDIGHIEHLWRYEPDTDEIEHESLHHHTPARYVTDRAIDVGRTTDLDRYILHYMQPHYPYVANALAEGRPLEPYEERPSRIFTHEYSKEKVFDAYLDDLRYVLDEIELLVQNFDADKVVITADHGDAFREYGLYGHDPGSIHPAVRKVPWVTTTATDQCTHEPEAELIESDDYSAEAQLHFLGYTQ